MQTILNKEELNLTLRRLAHQLTENHEQLNNLVFVGIQPRGVEAGKRIAEHIRTLYPDQPVHYGVLDITFYRDDVRSELHVANATSLPFSVDGKQVVLIDDVLYTGRTVRAALDALQDFGRPRKVELCVLVNRRFERELPIQPDYCGKTIDSSMAQKVKVDWEKEEAYLG